MGTLKGMGLILLLAVLGLPCSTLTGCAISPDTAPPPAPDFNMPSGSDDLSWWAYRFRIKWPPERPADLTVDLMLAHAVVKPSLDTHASKLSYWRFHRRAARDGTGHQFSFLFYSNPATARELYASLQASPVLKQVRDQGLVTAIVMDDPDKPVRPGVADTSDPHWSPTLQRHWPAYITGVSLLWLGLIDDAVAELPDGKRSAADPLAVYRAVDQRVQGIWYQEGQHAFLHHLSAVFGYRELLIVKPMRF